MNEDIRLELSDIDYPVDVESLPDTWAVTWLGRVVLEKGTGFSSGQYNVEGRGVPHLRPMNVNREGEVVLDEVKYVPRELVPEGRGWLRRGDVLFNNTNSAELVGKTAPVTEDSDWAFSNHMTRLRPHDGVSYTFVARQLHFLWMAGYFRQRSAQHVNQASVTLRKLTQTVPVVVPPRLEQLRIVAEVEKQFGRLSEAASRIAGAAEQLREYERTVLVDAACGRLFGQTAGDPTVDDTTPSSLDDRTNAGLSGWPPLPEGWMWTTVAKAGDVKLGRARSPKRDRGPERDMHPYLRVANVYEGAIDTTDVKRMTFTPEEYETYRLEPGDVLLNEGQSLTLVGRPAIFRGEVPGACFQNSLIRFRARPEVLPEFALIVFRSYLHGGEFQKVAKWSTRIAHLGSTRFKRMPFPLPPIAVQKAVVDEVDRRLTLAQKQTDVLETSRQETDRLRFALLQRAFSGSLLPQSDSEGTGAHVLEQIGSHKSGGSIPKKRRSGMRNRDKVSSSGVRRSVYDVLEEAGHALTPEDLFYRTGIGEELVDEFFEELKAAVESGAVEERRDDERSVYLVLSARGR